MFCQYLCLYGDIKSLGTGLQTVVSCRVGARNQAGSLEEPPVLPAAASSFQAHFCKVLMEMLSLGFEDPSADRHKI